MRWRLGRWGRCRGLLALPGSGGARRRASAALGVWLVMSGFILQASCFGGQSSFLQARASATRLYGWSIILDLLSGAVFAYAHVYISTTYLHPTHSCVGSIVYERISLGFTMGSLHNARNKRFLSDVVNLNPRYRFFFRLTLPHTPRPQHIKPRLI